jgi:hypothetical protein
MFGNMVVIMDEIHRLNKDKQDLLLPYLESGIITLIGMTTANPYHSINPAIRSRCQLFELHELNDSDVTKGIKKAINSDELVLFGAYPFDCAKKLILWNYVSEKFPEIQWVYNKKGELSKENFDASDSLICVLGLLGYEKYKDTKPHVVDFTSSINNQKTTLSYSYEFCDNIFSKTIEL